MNPYEHSRPVHKTKAADVNKHYAVGRWLLAAIERQYTENALAEALTKPAALSPAEPLYDRLQALEQTVEDATKVAEEHGVNIKEIERRLTV